MQKIISFTIFLLLIFGCKPQKNTKTTIINTVPNNFDMYKASEMAELMRTMLAENKKLKELIINEKSIGNFNKEYLKIHTAKLTDSTDFDNVYSVFANHFIQTQKDVFSVKKSDRKEQFNTMVNSCIACHTAKCTGPIPRIQKLKIK